MVSIRAHCWTRVPEGTGFGNLRAKKSPSVNVSKRIFSTYVEGRAVSVQFEEKSDQLNDGLVSAKKWVGIDTPCHFIALAHAARTQEIVYHATTLAQVSNMVATRRIVIPRRQRVNSKACQQLRHT